MAINGLEVTDVIIFPAKKVCENTALKAFAKVVINDQFIIQSIRVFEDKNGNPFIRYPQEQSSTNRACDICFPITAELRTYISEQVLCQYSITMGINNDPKPMKSTRFVTVKVEINHPDNVDPEDVLNECDYEFISQTNKAKIEKTEILGYAEDYLN